MKTLRSRSRLLTLAVLPVILLGTSALAQTPTSKPDPPKADDATRVGLVAPRVNLLGGGGSAMQESNSLRQNISSFLTGPRIGTVDIRAKLDTLALEEGRERGCEYVLYVSLTRKRQTAARGAGASFGSGTKAGDEFTFEYKITATDGVQSPVEKTLRATASADGQDVLTPMIETVALAVVQLARTAKPARSPVTAEVKEKPEAGATPQSTAPAPSPAAPAPVGYGSLTAVPKGSTNTRTNDPPKAEGTIRIGIVTPRLNSAGGGASGNTESASLRATLSSFLAGSTIETIDLKARLDNLALSEAQRRECDFVLYTTLHRKRSSSSTGRGGSLDSIMGNMGSGVGTKVPGAKKTQEISSEAARVSSTISQLARADDEITFTYRLVTSVGARPIATKTTKAKVKADGEDVLTPMIESAAQAIVDATGKN